MSLTSDNKKNKTLRSKKPRRVNASKFAGTVKAFKNFDAITYQKQIREN